MRTWKIDETWDLSRDEFADAISKGLGRAFLYVQDRGLDRVHDLVLNACLHDLSYDPQSEESRAKWLFTMFANSPYYLEFKDAILAALAVETETWDLLQLCQLAKEMALGGDIIAAGRLAERVYQHAAQPSIDDWLGADELIEIRGIDAAIELSRIYGRRLLANPDDFVPDTLEIFTNMSEETISIFDRYAATEESIATYYRYLVDRKSECNLRSEQSSQINKMSLERIIDRAKNKQQEFPLGRAKLADRQLTGVDSSTIDLFINNYHSGDAKLILAGLNDVEIDRKDLHAIGCSIINLSKKQADRELIILLDWIYPRTPCSYCRQSTITQLENNSQLSDRLLAEYQFDATQFAKAHSN